jgi:hypothetical protein
MEFIKTDQFLAFAKCIYKGLSTVMKPFKQYGMLTNLPESDLPKHEATDLVLKDLIQKIRSDVKPTPHKTTKSQ